MISLQYKVSVTVSVTRLVTKFDARGALRSAGARLVTTYDARGTLRSAGGRLVTTYGLETRGYNQHQVNNGVKIDF